MQVVRLVSITIDDWTCAESQVETRNESKRLRYMTERYPQLPDRAKA